MYCTCLLELEMLRDEFSYDFNRERTKEKEIPN